MERMLEIEQSARPILAPETDASAPSDAFPLDTLDTAPTDKARLFDSEFLAKPDQSALTSHRHNRARAIVAGLGLVVSSMTGIVASAETAAATPQSATTASADYALKASTSNPPLTFRQKARNTIDAGHRGNGQGYTRDEDTVESCLQSLHQGAGACESDVQETKDHQLILSHNSTLDYATRNCHGSISKLLRSQIYRCRSDHGYHIPSLSTYLSRIKASYPHAQVIVEMKPSNPSQTFDNRFAARLTHFGPNAAAESFFSNNLLRLKRIAPKITRLLINGNTKYPPYASSVNPNNFDGVIIPDSALNNVLRTHPNYVKAYTDHHRQVLVWGADSKATVAQAVKDGVGVISNYPSILVGLRK